MAPHLSEFMLPFWKQLQNDKAFCDMILACDNKQIPAHKIIISSSSPMFENILKQSSSQNTVIYLDGIEYGELVNLLNFIYQGEVNIAEKDLQKFMKIVKDFKIKGPCQENIVKFNWRNNQVQRKSVIKVSGQVKNSTDTIDIDNFEEIKQDNYQCQNEETKHKCSQCGEEYRKIEYALHKVIGCSGTFNVQNTEEFNSHGQRHQIDADAKRDKPNQNTPFTLLGSFMCDKSPNEKNDNEGKLTAKVKSIIAEEMVNNPKEDVFTKLKSNSEAEWENDNIDSFMAHSFDEKINRNKNANISAVFINEINGKVEIDNGNKDSNHYLENNEYRGLTNLNFISSKANDVINYTNNENERNANEMKITHLEKKVQTIDILKMMNQSIQKNKDAKNQINKTKKKRYFGKNEYICDKCAKKFYFPSALIAHRKYAHEGITYSCDKCKYKAKIKDHLKTHTNLIHEGIRYFCDQCGHKASTKSHLYEHIRSVHDEIKYSCDQCDYKAIHKNWLNRHNMVKHEGVRYSCDKCDHKFNSKGNLTIHKSAVHENTRYSCNKCNHQATQKANLKTHIKNKHLLV